MASSNSNHGEGTSQTEPPPPSTTTPPSNKNPDSTSSPPPPPPPPNTSYPTYPPYPPPYGQCYPPVPGGHNPYAYPQGYYAPYPHTYPNQYPPGYPPTATTYYGPPTTYPTAGSRSGVRCIRGFILCCCMLMMFIFLWTLILSLVLRPKLPVYKVVSMTVTDFTTTPSLTGIWDMKVTVENPNKKIRASFSDFAVDVMYKDGLVAKSFARGFELNTNEVKEMELKGWSSHDYQEKLEKATVDNMVKERATGSVTFDMTLGTKNAFRSDSLPMSHTVEVVICQGLKVVFQSNNATTGTLDNGGKPIECQRYF